MDKTYDPQKTEQATYRMWENGDYFSPKIVSGKKPYTILLPLPNANDPMHMGHALFTVQDILIRYHRMLGDPTLWLPGGDHAGIETQFVFEKKLAKEGNSRFDYDRETLYRMISEFVDRNRNINQEQMKRLGFSLDWSRYRYSLEPEIVSVVMDTFRKLHQDGLIYREERLVNFCTKCGTAFSDLEINHEERQDKLYYLDYGPIQIATARPETIFADVAVAVNPKDKRYGKLIGRNAIVPIIRKPVPIIADSAIQIEFGTGALKVTPAHDEVDYDIGSKHGLPVISCIDRSGRLINVPERLLGLKINKARQAVTEELEKTGLLKKTEPLVHTVSVCYRCKTVIEPLPLPQWFIRTKPLAKPALDAVKKGKTKIVPLKRFEKKYFEWLENIKDWNISRQIVWGPRLPVWYCLDCNPDIYINFINSRKEKVSGGYGRLSPDYAYEEIISGLQSVIAPVNATYCLEKSVCGNCHSTKIIQETDTFDTWFLSGQWPYTTLMTGRNKSDFEYFYPTSVLDTLWDILFFWVARMMMLGIYRTGRVPFEVIHLHSRVVDKLGQKMSKSKGNVVNPIEMVDRYGADALRMALIFGTAPGSDIVLSEDKIRGMRNFSNKLWNIGRLLKISYDSVNQEKSIRQVPFYDESAHRTFTNPEDKRIVSEVNMLTAGVTADLMRYRFSDALQKIYDFAWHTFADIHLEKTKQRMHDGDNQSLAVNLHVYQIILRLLHPFAPFITESIWGLVPKNESGPLIVAPWPTAIRHK